MRDKATFSILSILFFLSFNFFLFSISNFPLFNDAMKGGGGSRSEGDFDVSCLLGTFDSGIFMPQLGITIPTR